MADEKNLNEDENKEETKKTKKVKKTREEKRMEFKENHPKLSAMPGKIWRGGKKVLGGVAIVGGGIYAGVKALDLFGKPKYISVPGQKVPQVDAKPGVDFVDAPKETAEVPVE